MMNFRLYILFTCGDEHNPLLSYNVIIIWWAARFSFYLINLLLLNNISLHSFQWLLLINFSFNMFWCLTCVSIQSER